MHRFGKDPMTADQVASIKTRLYAHQKIQITEQDDLCDSHELLRIKNDILKAELEAALFAVSSHLETIHHLKMRLMVKA